AELAVLMERIRLGVPRRRSRRRAPARGGEADLRRTLRRSLRTGGEPVERLFRERRTRPRRLVLVLDVSGSMADYSRALVLFAHAVVWLNPLKGEPRYEPLARGMAAALPHVDLFVSGHNLASLEALGGQLAAL